MHLIHPALDFIFFWNKLKKSIYYNLASVKGATGGVHAPKPDNRKVTRGYCQSYPQWRNTQNIDKANISNEDKKRMQTNTELAKILCLAISLLSPRENTDEKKNLGQIIARPHG